MPARQATYLALSIVGLVLTWYHNIAFMGDHASPGAAEFIADVFVNHASSSIGWDITVAGTAFMIFVFAEAKRLGMKRVWVYVPLTLCIALAFAAPLFLFMRERKIAETTAG